MSANTCSQVSISLNSALGENVYSVGNWFGEAATVHLDFNPGKEPTNQVNDFSNQPWFGKAVKKPFKLQSRKRNSGKEKANEEISVKIIVIKFREQN